MQLCAPTHGRMNAPDIQQLCLVRFLRRCLSTAEYITLCLMSLFPVQSAATQGDRDVQIADSSLLLWWTTSPL